MRRVINYTLNLKTKMRDNADSMYIILGIVVMGGKASP